METKKILTRGNEPTVELRETVNKKFKGLELSFEEVYYLDYKVDEETGMIDKSEKVKHFSAIVKREDKRTSKYSFNENNPQLPE